VSQCKAADMYVLGSVRRRLKSAIPKYQFPEKFIYTVPSQRDIQTDPEPLNTACFS
jgi:hypothetical protein